MPKGLRRQVFEELHLPTHPGAKATARLASSRYIWLGMKKDIKMWARSCLGCQVSKVQRHPHPPVENIPIPQRRFSVLNVDLVGPLRESRGCKYMLTVIDRTTRFPLAVPISDITTETVWRTLLNHWISIFGFPSTIISDRGTQFTSSTWQTLCKQSGIEHQFTTAFHPQSNGLVERLHRRLKEALRARGAVDTWADDLPLVLLGLRVTPRADDNLSPAERMFGTSTSVPSSFPELRAEESDDYPSRMQRALDALTPPPTRPTPPTIPVFTDPKLAECSHVFVRRDGHKKPLEPLYDGPYKVVTRGRRHFSVQLGDKIDNITIERLKPVISATPVSEAVPRKRGRPKKTTFDASNTKSSTKTTSSKTTSSKKTSSSSSTTTSVPKRRGRPPKHLQREDDEEWTLVQPRRRRGTPRTPPATRSSTSTTTQRRGRPPRTS